MAAQTYRLTRLAGDFPPGLNRADPAWQLKEGETPDGYGFDLAYDGGIKVGICPKGTARIQKSIIIDEPVGFTSYLIPYFWHYGRLWNITDRTVSTPSNVLRYGAEFYDSIYFPQGLGKEVFNEDAYPILAIVPIEPDKMAVLKATGGYILSNLTDSRAYFSRSDIVQELALPAANQCSEMDSELFVANATAVTVYKEGQAVEISRKIRGETMTGMAMTNDNAMHRIILGSSLCFEVAAKKWFKYSGTSFRFTTRQMISSDWAPFSVDRLVFVIQHLESSENASLTYQVKYEDGDWTDERTVLLPYEAGKYTAITESLNRNLAAKRFQVRITDLVPTVVLREIWTDANAKQRDDWSA
jgi:hypothetical protein